MSAGDGHISKHTYESSLANHETGTHIKVTDKTIKAWRMRAACRCVCVCVSDLAMKAAALRALLLQIVAAQKWCLQNAGQCYGNQHTFTEVEPFERFRDLNHLTKRLADMDSDGDLDALVLKFGQFWFYERNSSGDLIEGTQLRAVQFAPGIRTWHSHGHFVFELTDWDRDGDLDVIIADVGSDCRFRFRYFEHIRPANASFFFIERRVPELLVLDPYICDADIYSLQIVDWNQDGYLDVILLLEPAETRYFQSDHGKLREIPAEGNPFHDLPQTICGDDKLYAIRVADWDNDGDLDVIAHCGGWCVQLGHCLLAVSYAQHLADGTFLTELSGWANAIDVVQSDSFCWDCLQVIDWNGDGLLDLFTNSRIVFRSRASGYVERKGDDNPFAGLLFAYAEPCLVDWDLDGHLDILVRESDHLRLFLQKQGWGTMLKINQSLNVDSM